MDEHLNNRQREVVTRLLANPADTGAAYLSNLQELVKQYPQSGLFRALYGRALNQPSPLVAGGYFDSMALHKLMFHHDGIAQVDNDEVVMQSPGKLFGAPPVAAYVPPAPVSETPVYAEEPVEVKAAPVVEETPVAEHTVEPPAVPVEETIPEYTTAEPVENPWENLSQEPATQTETHDEPLGRAPWEIDEEEEEVHHHIASTQQEQPAAEVEHTEPVNEEPQYYTEEITAQPEAEEPHIEVAPTAEHVEETPIWEMPWREEETAIHTVTTQEEETPVAAEDDLASKLAYYASLEDEYDQPETDTTEHFTYNGQPAHIEEETFDEITGIDEINLSQIAAEETPSYDTPVQPAEPNEADKLIMDNIVSTDFFRFDQAFGENKVEAPAEPEYRPEYFARPHEESAPQQTQPEVAPQPAAEPQPFHHDVSMYHDDKMPYTFTWWLDKTRREHGSLYQPYTKAPVNRPADVTTTVPAQRDALQQQYVENIFHLNTPEGLVPDADPKTVEFDMQSKEDRIIQRFITVDPHIHPPVGEKLDTENKAKRSSEDSDEMVTETLARIYADQMMFPKAIATYKKLMLKFPEKSRYFASRIENLEKKTN